MRYHNIKNTKLDEATISVPTSLKAPVLRIAGSVLLTLLKRKESEYKEKYPGQAQYQLAELNNAMGIVQQKCPGASLINDNELRRVMTTSLDLSLDPDDVIDELDNFKLKNQVDKLNAVYDKLENTQIMLKIRPQNSNTHGYVQPMPGGTLVLGITIRTDLHNPVHDVYDVITNIDHETQHLVQMIVISSLEGTDGKHLDTSHLKNTDNLDKDEEFARYVSSYVEFGPHISDFVNQFVKITEIFKMKGVLKNTSTTSTEISRLIKVTLQSDKSMSTFFRTLKERKPDMYQKAWRSVYKTVLPLYQEILNKDINYSYSDVQVKDIEENINVMFTVYERLKENVPDVKFIGYRGKSMNSITLLRLEFLGTEISVAKSGDMYRAELSYQDNYDSGDMDAKSLLGWIDEFDMYTQPGELFTSLNVMEHMLTGSTITPEVLAGVVKSAESVVNESGLQVEVHNSNDKYSLRIEGICTFDISIDKSGKYIRIESPEINYVRYDVSTMQVYSFFLHLCVNFKQDAEWTINVLETSATFMDVMFKFDSN